MQVENKAYDVCLRGYTIHVLTEGGLPSYEQFEVKVKAESPTQEEGAADLDADAKEKEEEIARIDGSLFDDGMHIQVSNFILVSLSFFATSRSATQVDYYFSPPEQGENSTT